MNKVEYDIHQFIWSKENNSFYADGWDLHTYGYHQSFPNDKEQFFILNPKTNNSRRFRFSKQTDSHYLFLSEDGIRCVICIDPDYYEKEIPQYPQGSW